MSEARAPTFEGEEVVLLYLRSRPGEWLTVSEIRARRTPWGHTASSDDTVRRQLRKLEANGLVDGRAREPAAVSSGPKPRAASEYSAHLEPRNMELKLDGETE